MFLHFKILSVLTNVIIGFTIHIDIKSCSIMLLNSTGSEVSCYIIFICCISLELIVVWCQGVGIPGDNYLTQYKASLQVTYVFSSMALCLTREIRV